MPSRPAARAAEETVALILDEDVPVPDSDHDVADLTSQLGRHILQLTALAEASITQDKNFHDAVTKARRLAGERVHADARSHLRHLATAVQQILSQLGGTSTDCQHTPLCPAAFDPNWEAATQRRELGYSLQVFMEAGA